MTAKIRRAMVLTVILCTAVFAATKDDGILKRITPLPARYAEMPKAIQKYEAVTKEIKAEIDRITRTYLDAPEEGKEMTPEEAMARYGGMGGAMTVNDIQLMQPIQECLSYILSDFIKENQELGAELNRIDSEMQKALDAERKKFEERTKNLSIDGEGARDRDIADFKKANTEYMAAQAKVFEKFIPRINRTLGNYRVKLSAVVTRAMTAYNGAFAATRNKMILSQAASLRAQTLGLISDFAESHRAKASWQPENRYNY